MCLLAILLIFVFKNNCLIFPFGMKVGHFFFIWEKNQSSFENGLWLCGSIAAGVLDVLFQVIAKGFAQYELLKSTALDDTVPASQTMITLDISWSPVDEILQIPPLSSAATLVGVSPVFC